jgi:hypothetical protein
MANSFIVVNHLKRTETILADIDRIFWINLLAFPAYKTCDITHDNNLLRCCNALFR